MLFIVLSRCCIYKLLYLLWRTRLTNWSKVESSIPDHDPHTTHIASVSPSYESSKTAIIPCTLLSHMPLFGTILHLVRTHCLVTAIIYLVYPSSISSCLCLFSISPVQLDLSQSLQSFSQHLYLCPLPSSSITICTDFFSSSLLLSLLFQVFAALTLIEISSHHRQRPNEM